MSYQFGKLKTQAKIFVDVSFQRKEKAKELGAKWDKDEKRWYITQGTYHKFMCDLNGITEKEFDINKCKKELDSCFTS